MSEQEKIPLTIEEAVLNDCYVGPTRGVSMRPMLKEGRDTIVVRAKNGRLQPLDVAIYKREGEYVLHRVLRVIEGGYVIRGDNCYSNELVAEEQVFGVLTEYFRKNKRVSVQDKSYLRYVKRRLRWYPARCAFVRPWRAFKRLVKKVLRYEKRGE